MALNQTAHLPTEVNSSLQGFGVGGPQRKPSLQGSRSPKSRSKLRSRCHRCWTTTGTTPSTHQAGFFVNQKTQVGAEPPPWEGVPGRRPRFGFRCAAVEIFSGNAFRWPDSGGGGVLGWICWREPPPPGAVNRSLVSVSQHQRSVTVKLALTYSGEEVLALAPRGWYLIHFSIPLFSALSQTSLSLPLSL